MVGSRERNHCLKKEAISLEVRSNAMDGGDAGRKEGGEKDKEEEEAREERGLMKGIKELSDANEVEDDNEGFLKKRKREMGFLEKPIESHSRELEERGCAWGRELLIYYFYFFLSFSYHYMHVWETWMRGGLRKSSVYK